MRIRFSVHTARLSISSEARDRNNPISPHQISLHSSIIEQKLHPIRCCSPVVLGLRQGQADQNRKLPSNVLAFARRHKITIQDLEKLFLLDHEPLLPVYKIPAGNITQAQLYKVMMVLLENGLLNNQLSAPYPELRETVKEDGLFDGNFNKMLKRNHSLFKGAVTKDGIKETGTVELTGAGLARLAELIKELGQA
jgi:hypothetical protein